jgi:hypothetical protein
MTNWSDLSRLSQSQTGGNPKVVQSVTALETGETQIKAKTSGAEK